jgi:hypothetical protein
MASGFKQAIRRLDGAGFFLRPDDSHVSPRIPAAYYHPAISLARLAARPFFGASRLSPLAAHAGHRSSAASLRGIFTDNLPLLTAAWRPPPL